MLWQHLAQGANLIALVAFEVVGFELTAADGGWFLQTFATTFPFPLPNTGALDLEKGALFTTAGECFACSLSSPANCLGAEGKRHKTKE